MLHTCICMHIILYVDVGIIVIYLYKYITINNMFYTVPSAQVYVVKYYYKLKS